MPTYQGRMLDMEGTTRTFEAETDDEAPDDHLVAGQESFSERGWALLTVNM